MNSKFGTRCFRTKYTRVGLNYDYQTHSSKGLRLELLEEKELLVKMRRENQSFSREHTITSHGLHVVRVYWSEWLIVALLLVLDILLNVIEPFHRFVGEDMMANLKYPLKDNTVFPFWALLIVAVLMPLLVISVNYVIKRELYNLHEASLGLLYSVFSVGVITDALKIAVGRPRPDFFWRCFPDGMPSFDPVTKNVICSGVKSVVTEGYKSFPSGHTSWCFAGLGFISWYLVGQTGALNKKRHVSRLSVVILPIVVAALVGVAQFDAYQHHWQDVLAGCLLGTLVASLCYLQLFPPPYDLEGWAPYLYYKRMFADVELLNPPSEST